MGAGGDAGGVRSQLPRARSRRGHTERAASPGRSCEDPCAKRSRLVRDAAPWVCTGAGHVAPSAWRCGTPHGRQWCGPRELAPVSGPRGPGASGWPCQRGSQACCAAPPPSVPEERWWEPCSLEKEQTGDSPAVSLKCKCSLKKGVISNAKYEGRCIF